MKDTLRIIRVFLASPGDLQDERKLAFNAVEELNKHIAPYFGYMVELVGWEDTLPKIGRPQETINLELDRCELFIGIMWKRWGTPPANSGLYSSGFEEEFERSILRYRETGLPDMAMYFKDIESDDLSDPGPNLQKVLEFKKNLISEKYILYNSFNSPEEFQKSVRDKITAYLINLSKTEKEDNKELHSKTRSSGSIDKKEDFTSSPLSIEGHNFLEGFLDDSKNSIDDVTPLNVARFRLLSSAITQTENDKFFLGPHDANIIFSNRFSEYGQKERSMLISSGLNNFMYENAPLWYWYNNFKTIDNVDILAFKSLNIKNEKISIGAIEAMKLVGVTLDFDDDFFERKVFIQSWFSEKSTEETRLAALRYLKLYGKYDDLEFIEPELKNTNSNVAKLSLETYLSIQLRYKKSEAVETVFSQSFDSIDDKLLNEILTSSPIIKTDLIELGLSHRNKKLRHESLKRIIKIRELKAEELNQLKNDSYKFIRYEIVKYLQKRNRSLDDTEVKSILVKGEKTSFFGGNAFGDMSEEECYDDFLYSNFSKLSEKKLLENLDKIDIYDDVTFFALCDNFFKNHSEELRNYIDNQFQDWFDEYILKMKNHGTSEENLTGLKNLKIIITKIRTRRGLDLLGEKEERVDLDRIRKNMNEKFVGSSIKEIDYLSKLGEWEDIKLIINSEKENVATKSLFFNDKPWDKHKAKAIYNIGKDRLEELFKEEIPDRLLVELINLCSISKFSELSDLLLFNFLMNKSDDVRKFASLKIIQSFNKTKIKTLLNEYIEKPEYRYYNVIYWLDFGVTMPKQKTIRAIKILLSN